MLLSHLADQIGVEPDQLLDPAALARLPRPTLVAVAQAVNFPVAQLFTRHGELTYGDDAATIGACLGGHPQGLTRDTLARALRWDLDRVENTLRSLDTRLATVGLRLTVDGTTIRIDGLPGLLKAATARALERGPGDGHVDPDLGQAAWIATFGHDIRDGPAAAMTEAFRRHLIESNGYWARGSEAVRFSLMLTERGH